MSALKRLLPGGRHAVIGVPFVWLLLFFLLPFAIVLKISFAEVDVAIPPYTEIVTWADNHLSVLLNLGNYAILGEDELYIAAYLGSLKIAAIGTLLCLLIGYPMAYAISRASKEMQTVWLLLVMMPTWTAILIRVYAWMGILSNNGLLNSALLGLGLIDAPLQILNTDLAVYIGIVYAYLPFMILPIYANLAKHDPSLLEAAADLGAAILVHPWDMMGAESMPKYWLPWLVGMPAEQSRAACCLVFGGVLERLPKLRIALAHGGGSFPYTIGRIEHGFNMRPDLVDTDNFRNPREYLKRLYFDSWVADDAALRYLLEDCGSERVMLGTDYPFPLGEQVPGEGIERLDLADEQRARLYHGTALEWLGLSASRFA